MKCLLEDAAAFSGNTDINLKGASEMASGRKHWREMTSGRKHWREMTSGRKHWREMAGGRKH